MKCKRGFLLGEFTLKTIIAVISLVFLLYLLFSLYSIFQGKKEISEAETTLDKIIELIGNVDSKGEQSYILLEPKSKLSFSLDAVESCTESCLCLRINRADIPYVTDRDLIVCKKTDVEIDVQGEVEILGPKKPVDILIKKDGEKYVIKQE